MSLIKEELVSRFITYPNYFKKGAEFLANQFNCTAEEVRASRLRAKEILKGDEDTHKDVYISELEGASILEERLNSDTGETTVILQSNKPLSPDEIDKLVSVDNVTRYVSMTWLKSHKNGVWTYSIATKSLIKDFYNLAGLQERIKTLLPQFTPVEIPFVTKNINRSLVVYIADDHAGMLLEGSIFGNEWNEIEYEKRLLKIVERIKNSNDIFEEIIVVSLGDQLNGWNAQTTRGGHIVPSLSNRDQFDIYTRARRRFYDELFLSEKSNNYSVYEVNDSNHSGLGFSYMANQFLKLYVENKYPSVVFRNEEDFITHIPTMGHNILAVHGKDERDQTRNFPLNLDPKTEVYFTDYILEKGLNPKHEYVHVMKADLHRYNENRGKSFRYINVPSISVGSSWQEKNFSSSYSAALLEMYERGNPEPLTQLVRF